MPSAMFAINTWVWVLFWILSCCRSEMNGIEGFLVCASSSDAALKSLALAQDSGTFHWLQLRGLSSPMYSVSVIFLASKDGL